MRPQPPPQIRARRSPVAEAREGQWPPRLQQVGEFLDGEAGLAEDAAQRAEFHSAAPIRNRRSTPWIIRIDKNVMATGTSFDHKADALQGSDNLPARDPGKPGHDAAARRTFLTLGGVS